ETIRVRFSGGGLTVDKTLAATDYKGEVKLNLSSYPDPFQPNTGQLYGVTAREWKQGNGDTIDLFDLEERYPGLGTVQATGDVTEWVKPVRWALGSGLDLAVGYGLLGDAATAIPTTGKARFLGQATGRREVSSLPGSSYAPPSFLARATVDIDFAAATVRGGVEDFAFEYNAPASRYDFNFEATLANGKFETTKIDAPMQTGETGTVRGQLYGPGSDLEVGGVFDLTFADGKVAGAFVAGNSTGQALFGADKIDLYSSLVNIVSQPGSAQASYNQNNIELGGNNEVLAYTPGGVIGADDGYRFYTDNGTLPLLSEFTSADYKGRTTKKTARPSGQGKFRVLEADTWTNGPTLNRWILGGNTGNNWTHTAYVQALEYVNPNVSPGVEHRAYMATGARTTAVPTTGAARYRGETIGSYVDIASGDRLTAIGGTTVDVFFDSGQVRGAFGFITLSRADGTVVTSGPNMSGISFAGIFNANRTFDAALTGNVTYNNVAPVGQVHGAFYGPGSAELGAIYDINIPGYAAIAGVLVGARDTLNTTVGYQYKAFTDTPGASLLAVTAAPATGVAVTWARDGMPGGDTASFKMVRAGQAVDASFAGNFSGQNYDVTDGSWAETAFYTAP
ncbi:MAG TPA: transferrin-binding protein-like solute binding protein, partial [Caulobacter sp.]|nr:transferrin-binding protein-like solute binding protein [Caulobacter sp.]